MRQRASFGQSVDRPCVLHSRVEASCKGDTGGGEEADGGLLAGTADDDISQK